VLDPYLEFSGGYGPEVDLWALGVILYSMLCGFPPFWSDSNPDLIRQIRKAEYTFPSPYWDEVSEAARSLVVGLLVVDPARRFTAHECLAHPWISGAGEASARKLHRCGIHASGGWPWAGCWEGCGGGLRCGVGWCAGGAGWWVAG
jgi:serine/threonine protein kinase